MGKEKTEKEGIESLDASDVNEIVEFMKADDSVDEMSYRSDEDEDSEVVQRLYENPKYIVPKSKNPKQIR